MPRAKKNAKAVTYYMDLDVLDELDHYCKETGLSKTVAVERFIRKCVDEYRAGRGNTPLHSGFEAPVIGTLFPRGTTYIKNDDGTVTPVFPQEKE